MISSRVLRECRSKSPITSILEACRVTFGYDATNFARAVGQQGALDKRSRYALNTLPYTPNELVLQRLSMGSPGETEWRSVCRPGARVHPFGTTGSGTKPGYA